jgi:hypothetical protein
VAIDGFTPDTVVIEPALVGDANLDGKVNFTDFQLLAASFNQTGTSWDQGDFNYAGKTNFTDFQLLAANFNDSTSLDNAQFEAMNALALSHGQILSANPGGDGFSFVSVPEPGMLGISAFASLGWLSRRKRKQRTRGQIPSPISKRLSDRQLASQRLPQVRGPLYASTPPQFPR